MSKKYQLPILLLLIILHIFFLYEIKLSKKEYKVQFPVLSYNWIINCDLLISFGLIVFKKHQANKTVKKIRPIKITEKKY